MPAVLMTAAFVGAAAYLLVPSGTGPVRSVEPPRPERDGAASDSAPARGRPPERWLRFATAHAEYDRPVSDRSSSAKPSTSVGATPVTGLSSAPHAASAAPIDERYFRKGLGLRVEVKESIAGDYHS